MAFKLIESAQAHWRAVNAPNLVALVRAGATFVNGVLVFRPARADQTSLAPYGIRPPYSDSTPRVGLTGFDWDSAQLRFPAAIGLIGVMSRG
jgi:hypothetical protein